MKVAFISETDSNRLISPMMSTYAKYYEVIRLGHTLFRVIYIYIFGLLPD